MKNFRSKSLVAICSLFLIFVVTASSQEYNHAKAEILRKLTTQCNNAAPFKNSTYKHNESNSATKYHVSFLSVAVFSLGNVAKQFNPELSFLILANQLVFSVAHFGMDIKHGTSYVFIQCQSPLQVSLNTTLKNNQVGTEYSDIANPHWTSDGVRFQKIFADYMLVSLNMSTLPRTLNVTCAEQYSQYESSIGFSIFQNKLVIQASLDSKADFTENDFFVKTMSTRGILRICLPMLPSGTKNAAGWLDKSTPVEDFTDDDDPAENLLLYNIIIITGCVMVVVLIWAGMSKMLHCTQELNDVVIEMSGGETRARVPPLE